MTPAIATARTDAPTRCETAPAVMGLCDGVVEGVVVLLLPVDELDGLVVLDAFPGFVTLKKFPARTLSSSPADVKAVRTSNPNRSPTEALRAASPASDTSVVSTTICVLKDLVLAIVKKGCFKDYSLSMRQRDLSGWRWAQIWGEGIFVLRHREHESTQRTRGGLERGGR